MVLLAPSTIHARFWFKTVSRYMCCKLGLPMEICEKSADGSPSRTTCTIGFFKAGPMKKKRWWRHTQKLNKSPGAKWPHLRRCGATKPFKRHVFPATGLNKLVLQVFILGQGFKNKTWHVQNSVAISLSTSWSKKNKALQMPRNNSKSADL